MKYRSFITPVAILVIVMTVTTSVSAKTIEVQDLSAKQKKTLQIAKKAFSDPIMVKIAFCESSLEHTEDDGSVKRGKVDPRDTGLMQINLGYHAKDARRLGLDVTNIQDNIAYANHLKRHQGTQPWSASRHCWSKLRFVG